MAEFQIGHKKVGGREKGAPNKDKKAFRELLDHYFPGYDPVIQMAGLAQSPDVPLELRIYCASKVAEYMHPKRKAVEINAELESSVGEVIEKAYRERVVR